MAGISHQALLVPCCTTRILVRGTRTSAWMVNPIENAPELTCPAAGGNAVLQRAYAHEQAYAINNFKHLKGGNSLLCGHNRIHICCADDWPLHFMLLYFNVPQILCGENYKAFGQIRVCVIVLWLANFCFWKTVQNARSEISEQPSTWKQMVPGL